MMRIRLGNVIHNGILAVAAVIGIMLTAVGDTQVYATTTTYTLKALSNNKQYERDSPCNSSSFYTDNSTIYWHLRPR
jgi:hypothetical protein